MTKQPQTTNFDDELARFCSKRKQDLNNLRNKVHSAVRCEPVNFSVSDISLLDILTGWIK
jgi:hypothetical protein